MLDVARWVSLLTTIKACLILLHLPIFLIKSYSTLAPLLPLPPLPPFWANDDPSDEVVFGRTTVLLYLSRRCSVCWWVWGISCCQWWNHSLDPPWDYHVGLHSDVGRHLRCNAPQSPHGLLAFVWLTMLQKSVCGSHPPSPMLSHVL
jgi:hypothetical protein